MIRLITLFIAFTLLVVFSLSAQNEKRPQDPTDQLSYISEDIYFTNSKADNIKLAGTLTIPKNVKQPSVAILISGSGPQNRNSEIKQFNHRPFLVLSDYLTKNGIAVLRYDDRGIADSEGDFSTATSYDFATDVEAAVTYLKTRTDIDTTKIGLIGHSEGGIIAPIVAANSTSAIAFTVLLAAPGVSGDKVLNTQARKAGELAGAPASILDENQKLSTLIYDIIKTETHKDSVVSKITSSLNAYKTNNPSSPISAMINPAMIKQQTGLIKSKWLVEFIKFEPKTYLSKTTCPVLALNGSLDCQVLPKINLEGIKQGLDIAQNKDVTIMELEGMNHLFQKAQTGSIQEYGQIKETFSADALKIIANWINERF
jgi:alpha/beta superfamily hydrolase